MENKQTFGQDPNFGIRNPFDSPIKRRALDKEKPDEIKIKKLREANDQYYFRKIVFRPSSLNFPKENPDNLNDDVLFEICKYLGKNCGLVTRALRIKWLESGISVKFENISRTYFPQYLNKYVGSITLGHCLFRSTDLEKFKKLREVRIYQDNIPFGGAGFIAVVKIFEKIEKIIIDEPFYHRMTWAIAFDKISTANIYVEANETLIKYEDYRNMNEKFVDDSLIRLLLDNKPLDLEIEAKYSITFKDLAIAYLYFHDRVYSLPRKVPKITLYVAISNDPLQIDYCINVFSKLYDNLGIKLEIDLFGKLCGHPENISTFKKATIYDSLMYIDKNKLMNLVKFAIEFYSSQEQSKRLFD